MAVRPDFKVERAHRATGQKFEAQQLRLASSTAADTDESLFVSSAAAATDESLFVSSTAADTDESLCVAVSAPRGRSLEIVQISAQFVPDNDHEVHGVSNGQSSRFRVTTRPTNKVGNHLSTREVQRFPQGIRSL